MANVKISNFPVPFALPVAPTINGTETLPLDQTVGGIVTTVSATFARLLGPVAVNYTNSQVSIGPAVAATGPALTVSNLGSLDTVALNATSGRFTSLLFENAASIKAQLFWDNTNSVFSVGSTANTLTFDAAGLQSTFSTTSSGQYRISLVQAGVANGDLAEIQLSSGATSFAVFAANAATAAALVAGGPTGAQGLLRTLNAAPIVFGTSNTFRGQISTTGNWIVPAPSSGVTLTTTATAAGAAALQVNTSATTGAQTATFTATNKPGTGTTGPDKWLPVNLDGTLHYIPCFL